MEEWKYGRMEVLVKELVKEYFHTSILPYFHTSVISKLHIKPKVHNVPVLHSVILSFNS